MQNNIEAIKKEFEEKFGNIEPEGVVVLHGTDKWTNVSTQQFYNNKVWDFIEKKVELAYNEGYKQYKNDERARLIRKMEEEYFKENRRINDY